MKRYRATATYIGEKSRRKGAFPLDTPSDITIDAVPQENGGVILSLRRPTKTHKVEAYYASWDELKTEWDIEHIEEV